MGLPELARLESPFLELVGRRDAAEQSAPHRNAEARRAGESRSTRRGSTSSAGLMSGQRAPHVDKSIHRQSHTL